MSIIAAAIRSLEDKGYMVVAENEGKAATIFTEAPDGSTEQYIGPLVGVSGWVNQRVSFAESETEEAPPDALPMTEDQWDELYGDYTDEDVAAALAPPTQEETRALVPMDSQGEVVKVTGLKAWMLKQKETALAETRARLAFMQQAQVIEPEAPPVQVAPKNFRSKLLDAAYRRKWAFVEFHDRFGTKTTRAMLVYGVTESYVSAFCEMRYNELYPAFMKQFLETWNATEGYGYAGNKPCRSKAAVKAWAIREATRMFKLDGFKDVQILENRTVPPPRNPKNWVIPLTDEALRRAKRPCYTENPEKYVSAGNYIQYSDILGFGQEKEG